MMNPRNAILPGIAALALVAAAGLAAAQNDQNASSKTNQPGSTVSQSAKMHRTGANAQSNGSKMGQATESRSMKMNKAGGNAQSGGGKMGQNAQAEKQTTAKYRGHAGKTAGKYASTYQGSKGRTAQVQKRERHMMMMTQRHVSKAVRTAEVRKRHGQRTTTAARHEERGTLKGLHAVVQPRENVTLNAQQRTTIRNTVIEARGAPRVGQVNFDVRVGTVIPQAGVRIVPVPETLVRIEPTWRGLRYFIYAREIVIVNPRDMKIVAVLPV